MNTKRVPVKEVPPRPGQLGLYLVTLSTILYLQIRNLNCGHISGDLSFRYTLTQSYRGRKKTGKMIY